jgi:outer membrane immunogenic protein
MKQLKQLGFGIIGALALTAVTPVANAADVYRREPSLKDAPVADYGPPIGWGGLYVGVNAGAAFDNADTFDNSDTTFIYGGHLGYNWQGAGPLVIGVEGDITGADDDAVDYLATIRGRLGYSFGRTLLYGTAGAAFVGFSDDFGGDSDTGWVAGGGLEHKIRDNVSIGVEGLYYSFDDNNNNDNADFWTARARLTYHFGDFGRGLK